jgi:hypothetical protein
MAISREKPFISFWEKAILQSRGIKSGTKSQREDMSNPPLSI